MWVEITVGMVGSVVGAIASSLTIWSNLRRPVDALKEKVDRLESDRMVKLERKMEQHCDSDKSQMILATLENLRGDVAKVDNKLDRIAEESARHDAKIEANAQYIKNLDNSFEKHKSGVHNHGH